MQNPCGRQGRFDAYSSLGTSTNIYKEPSERHVAEVKYMLSGRFYSPDGPRPGVEGPVREQIYLEILTYCRIY